VYSRSLCAGCNTQTESFAHEGPRIDFVVRKKCHISARSSNVQPFRFKLRRQLDQEIASLENKVPTPPPRGWVRAIRTALGMSTYELSERVGLSASRVLQLEAAEADGSIRLEMLRRVAHGLNCRVVYALIPAESLDAMVRAQAHRKAAEELARRPRELVCADDEVIEETATEQLWARAYQLVDSRGLWRDGKSDHGAGPI
jgi:predicted DNA-binding mobile mystery protein A